jgi:predicted nucleic acid-binding protein
MAQRLILDSGALTALAAGHPGLVRWVFAATRKGVILGIPAPVLAETTTGRQADAGVNRVIPSGQSILPTTDAIARLAGNLRFQAKRPDATVDALIVATAMLLRRTILLTDDISDIRLLAEQRLEFGLSVREISTSPASFDK